MKRVRVVGGAIRRGDTILSARRGASMSLPGEWEFPGGKVEEGEAPEASLVRELREELAVTVEVGDFVARGTVANESREIVLDIYWCTITDGELEAREHDELRWLEVGEIWSVGWAEADLPAVHEIERVLSESA